MPIRGKTNKQKLSTNSPNTKLAQTLRGQTWINFKRAEMKRKKEFRLEAWEKEILNTVSLKKIMKRQRNTTKIKEQTRNTEVQITEEELGKLPEKE